MTRAQKLTVVITAAKPELTGLKCGVSESKLPRSNTFQKFTLLTFKPNGDGCQIKPLIRIIMSGEVDPVCVLLSSNLPTRFHTFSFNQLWRQREREKRRTEGG